MYRIHDDSLDSHPWDPFSCSVEGSRYIMKSMSEERCMLNFTQHKHKYIKITLSWIRNVWYYIVYMLGLTNTDVCLIIILIIYFITYKDISIEA